MEKLGGLCNLGGMAKSTWSIINGIAWQHGITDPKILEAGTYPPKQARVLWKMAKKCLRDKSERSFYLYIQQKARFIAAGTKPFGNTEEFPTFAAHLPQLRI